MKDRMDDGDEAKAGERPRGERRKDFLRTLTFVFERFGEHELANHAAAGAYAFLLSATPALLLVVGLSTSLLSAWPAAAVAWLEITEEVFGELAITGPLKSAFTTQIGTGAAIFAFLSLVWASRLFILAVQRGIRVIWGISPLAKPMRDNIVTFVLEFTALVLVVVVLGAADAFGFFVDYLSPLMGETISQVSRVLVRAVPAVFLFLYPYLTFRFIPPKGPRRWVAALSALLCLGVYLAIGSLLSFAIDRSRYDLLYGVFGGLIVVLLKVWMFFMVYFHCAELSYVLKHFDSLLLARFLRVSRNAGSGKLASSLFRRPHRLLGRFGRRFAAGELVFREGDLGKEAYYLVEGRVGVWLGEGEGERKVAEIGEGELFGEVAELVAGGRTATIRTLTAVEAIVLPPSLFQTLLENDPRTSRRLIELLSLRLKESNLRLAPEGAMDPFVERRRGPREAGEAGATAAGEAIAAAGNGEAGPGKG